LGGIAVKYFAIAMIVGILVGTYSSIFIASTSLFLLGADNKAQD
jgi:preprotein translocase subunit SecF